MTATTSVPDSKVVRRKCANPNCAQPHAILTLPGSLFVGDTIIDEALNTEQETCFIAPWGEIACSYECLRALIE